jgi:hypothetical protein
MECHGFFYQLQSDVFRKVRELGVLGFHSQMRELIIFHCPLANPHAYALGCATDTKTVDTVSLAKRF